MTMIHECVTGQRVVTVCGIICPKELKNNLKASFK